MVMSQRAVSVSLGLTYCIAMVAGCFVLLKVVAWLSGGVAMLAHSIGHEAQFVINGRPAGTDSAHPVLVHRGGDDQGVRSPIWW